MILPQRRRLSHSGQVAELSQDELTDHGVMLSIGGAEQSHVELGDPDFLLHDYLRRMRSVVTTWAGGQPGHTPRSVLHLGAGALTLPRWIAHWRPSTAQTVVDIEPELVAFVLEHLPMTPAPENIVGDAAAVLAPAGALSGRTFDTVVVDLFNSAAAPPALTSPEFFRSVWGAVAPGGLLLVNMGDDAEMTFAKHLTRTILEALPIPPRILPAQRPGGCAGRAGGGQPRLRCFLPPVLRGCAGPDLGGGASPGRGALRRRARSVVREPHSVLAVLTPLCATSGGGPAA